MNELSDEEFLKTVEGATDQAPPVQSFDGMSDDQFNALFDKKTPEPDDTLFAPVKPFVDYYSQKWQNGEATVTRGNMGWSALRGDSKYEDIKANASILHLSGQDNPYRRNVPLGGMHEWVGGALESLPFMKEVLVGGGKGAAGGAAIGAGTALGVGALIPTPEEVLTVPAGATLGAQWGFKIGKFATSAKLMSGQLYLDLRDKGVSHETARTVGVAGGAIEGFIEAAQINLLGSVAKKEFVKQLSTQAGKNVLGRFIKEYVKDVGMEVGEEELQSVTELVASGVAGFVEKNPDAIPKADEIANTLIETAIKSAQASTILVGGSKVAGGVGGVTVNSISSRLLRQQQIADAVTTTEGIKRGGEVATGLAKRLAAGRMNLEQATKILSDAINQPAITEEQKQQTIGQSVDQALDELSIPVNQEQTPLVGRILKTMGDALEPPPDSGSANAGSGNLEYAATEDTVYSQEVQPALPDTELPTPELQARAKKVDESIGALDKEIAQVEKMIDARDFEGKQNQLNEAQAEYEKAVRTAERLEKKFNNQELSRTTSQSVLDKLEKAYADEQAARKRMKAAERAFRLVDPNKTATTALTNKLNRLYEQRATLETEQALLSEGLLSPEEIKRAQVKMTVGELLSQRAKAVSKILKSFAQGQRQGARFSRAEVKEIQQNIVSLIRSSDLNAKDKGKFLSTLSGIQTEAQLMRSLPKIQKRIDQLIEAEDRRKVKKEIARALKQTGLAKSGKRAVGKFGSADTQRILDTYKRAILDPDWRYEAISRGIDLMAANVDKSVAAMNKGDATIQDYTVAPDKEIMETLIAQRVGDFENKSVEDQRNILEEIKAIMAGGRAEKIDQKLELAAQRETAIAGALESIQGNKPLETLNPANARESLKTTKNELAKLLRTIGRQINSWNGLMVILSQNDQNNALAEIADIHETMTSEIANAKKYREKLIDTLIKSVGRNKNVVLDRVVSGSKKEQMGEYVNQDGEHVKLFISRNQAIKLWMQMHDPDLEAGLKDGNQYTFPEDVSPTQKSTYALLDEVLTKDDKALASGLSDFYSAYYDRVNAEWEDETGASLGRNDSYSGYARRTGTQDNGTASFFHEQFSRSTVKPASTIARKANAKPLELSDAFTDALKHVQDFEHWIAWRKPDKIIRSVFSNPDIRNAVKLKYGDGMLRTVDDRYNDLIGTRQEQLYDALKFLDRIRLNAGTSFVGGKPLNLFKQLTAAVNFMLDVNPVEFADGVADFMMHPKKAIETMERSELLKSRVETFNRDIMEALTRDDITSLKRRPKLNDLMMWYTKYGDRAAIWAGGWSVYRATLKKTGSEHKAMVAFEKSFNSTQQSGTPDSMSQLERSGQFGKILTLFLKQPIQMLERESNDIRKAMALPNKENILKAINTVAVVHTSTALFQIVGSAIPWATGDDEKRREEEVKVIRAFILGPLAGLPLLGDTINAGATAITNWTFDTKERVWKPKFLPYEAAGSTYDLFKQVFEALTSDEGVEIEDLFKILKSYTRSIDLVLPAKLGGGVPKEPIINFLDWLLVPEEQRKAKKK